MEATKRIIVIEVSEEFYEWLTQEAMNAERSLAELLIGHACVTALNSLASDGDMRTWRYLIKLWREFDPVHAPDDWIAQLFE